MGLDKLFKIFVPEDKVFIPLLLNAGENLVKGAMLHQSVMNSTNVVEREKLINLLTDVELKGDELFGQVCYQLNLTFLTPFDREDIYELAVSIESMLDALNASSRRLSLYHFEELTPELLGISDLVISSAREITNALSELTYGKRGSKISEAYLKIQKTEKEIDSAVAISIATLYDTEHDIKTLLRTRDLLKGFEEISDRAERISHVYQRIAVKLS